MTTTDPRIIAMQQWLTETLHLTIQQCEPASSDASFRRYFRVIHNQGQQKIVMDAPPDKEDIQPFIKVAQYFKRFAVHVPQIYQQNLEQGFLLLEDFGSSCFLDQLNTETVDQLYQSAFNTLYQLATMPLDTTLLPEYDDHLLQQEIDLFYDWFLGQSLQLTLSNTMVQTLNQLLIESALEQPRICVHRDFHCRNLMYLADQSPGVIDFQDAVMGPITYDLVSLLRDCYIAWPAKQVNQWLEQYFQHIKHLGLIDCSLATFTRWFDLMGLQRHLKAIGIFSRLNLRDHKPTYLNDIPLTLTYVNQVCQKYSELRTFNQYLNQQVFTHYPIHL